ncbi:MAG: hypothetical protein ACR2P1_19435 [Pseudomonadales bacterium]
MSKISIKDLPDSIEMDREAMAAVYGGASSARVTAGLLLQKQQQNTKMSLLDRARGKPLGRR